MPTIYCLNNELGETNPCSIARYVEIQCGSPKTHNELVSDCQGHIYEAYEEYAYEGYEEQFGELHWSNQLAISRQVRDRMVEEYLTDKPNVSHSPNIRWSWSVVKDALEYELAELRLRDIPEPVNLFTPIKNMTEDPTTWQYPVDFVIEEEDDDSESECEDVEEFTFPDGTMLWKTDDGRYFDPETQEPVEVDDKFGQL